MTETNSTPQVVTIAGVDSGGCAGIQADLKTFQVRQAFGMNIVVALTAQNTLDVQAALPVPTDFIDQQFQSLSEDYHLTAAKTGMLADAEHVHCVAENLKNVDFGPLVVDPVMIAKGGHPLLEADAVETVKTELIPLATIVTPNLPEAKTITEMTIETPADMQTAGQQIQALGAKNVVIKGGHLKGDQKAPDYVLLEDGTDFWMQGQRVDTENTHGTGDTFASAIAAELSKGETVETAIKVAKQFIQGAIEDGIHVGHGHGPVNHWAALSDHVTFAETLDKTK